MKKKRIGIPRSNNYYKDGVFWRHFFLHLKCNIVLSSETNNKIINSGEKDILNNCFQNKIKCGLIKELSNNCDYILVYQTCCYNKKCINYEILKENIKNDLLSSQILYFNPNNIKFIEIIKVALKITKNPIKIIYSYILAKIKHKKYIENNQNNQKNKVNNQNNKALIIGNSTKDKYISYEIINKLKENNIEPLYYNNLSQKSSLFFSKQIPFRIKNKEIKKILGSIYYYQYIIKHIIYIQDYNCQLERYIYIKIKSQLKSIPITIFEINNNLHTDTKLELLIDTINN